MKTWDVIVVGGGIIGLSLALELRQRGAGVLVVERGECGREASYAAGGMLADCTLETPAILQPLAMASARMYPGFVQDLEADSGKKVDLRDYGTILFLASEPNLHNDAFAAAHALPAPLAQLEPALASIDRRACYLEERSVDPRAATSAVLAAARRHGVDISSGEEVIAVNVSDSCVS
ncbi:MAG: FAD-dependent oxidoreductase, partial [Candidatus Sulfotelmatobacter sp.]